MWSHHQKRQRMKHDAAMRHHERRQQATGTAVHGEDPLVGGRRGILASHIGASGSIPSCHACRIQAPAAC